MWPGFRVTVLCIYLTLNHNKNKRNIYWYIDIKEFARRIGIEIDKEPELLYLAKEGLNEKLPHPWKPW